MMVAAESTIRPRELRARVHSLSLVRGLNQAGMVVPFKRSQLMVWTTRMIEVTSEVVKNVPRSSHKILRLALRDGCGELEPEASVGCLRLRDECIATGGYAESRWARPRKRAPKARSATTQNQTLKAIG